MTEITSEAPDKVIEEEPIQIGNRSHTLLFEAFGSMNLGKPGELQEKIELLVSQNKEKDSKIQQLSESLKAKETRIEEMAEKAETEETQIQRLKGQNDELNKLQEQKVEEWARKTQVSDERTKEFHSKINFLQVRRFHPS